MVWSIFLEAVAVRADTGNPEQAGTARRLIARRNRLSLGPLFHCEDETVRSGDGG
jgi:hypothetical protein